MPGSRLEPIRIPTGFWDRDDVAQALSTRDIGSLFRLIQKWTGAGQTQLAATTGLTQAQVSDAIRGRRRFESIKVFERIADGIGFPDGARLMIGLAPQRASMPSTGDDGMRTRLPCHNASSAPNLTPGTISSDGATQAAAIPEGTWPDDDTPLIPSLSNARDRFERMYRQVGGIAIRPRIAEFVHHRAVPLLDAPQSEANRHASYRATGGLVALAGICSYDAEEQEVARRNFLKALELARAAKDPVFEGYVSGLLANQALRTGRFREAVMIAETSLRDRQGWLTPALTADLLCSQAEAYARMGDRRHTFANIKTLDTLSGRIRLADEPAETRHVQPGVVEGRQGEALRQLGEFDLALQYSERSDELGSQIHPRGRANRLIGQINLALSQRHPDKAAAVGLSLLDLVDGMESGLLRKRVKGILRTMSSYEPSIIVRSFCEQADAVLNTPT